MRKYLILLLLPICICSYGQRNTNDLSSMIQAGIYMNKKSVTYDPSKAFEIYKSCANQGNALAMNILGILYSEGTGTTINQQEALRWFELSAKKRYPEAYNNLGNIYRTGWGVEQNFNTAYQWFEMGTKVNSSTCMYYQGYMLYKGLGVTQNYEKAVSLFRKGIKKGSLGSMYMLGLCLRNGYGILKNSDSARYWLKLAAKKGYRFAQEELQTPEPENKSINLPNNAKTFENNQYKSALVGKTEISPTFQKVAHNVKSVDITGEYTGYVIRYDFSGKHVIGNSEVKLKLDTNGNFISGSWKEGNGSTISLQAEMTDSGLIFNNTAYLASDHYSASKLESYLFKNARLHVVRQMDSVYLAGNIQLWSATRNEPEKPMYISMVRNTPFIKKVSSCMDSINVKTIPVSELKVYPNPFKKGLQVSFFLKEQSRIDISIVDLTGRIVYRENPRSLTSGKYNLMLQPNLQLGAYLLTLSCNGQVKSTVIIKQ